MKITRSSLKCSSMTLSFLSSPAMEIQEIVRKVHASRKEEVLKESRVLTCKEQSKNIHHHLAFKDSHMKMHQQSALYEAQKEWLFDYNYHLTMLVKRSWTSYNLRSFLELIHCYRASSSNVSTVSKMGRGLSVHQGLQLINTSSQEGRRFDSNMMKSDKVAPSPVPNPPGSNFSHWAKWILGTILSILLPFWERKWEELKMVEGESEIIVEDIEHVAEVVEKVATVAEKVSEEVAEVLPENGKLKETAVLIEAASKVTAHGAKLAQDFVHKVDAVKHDIDDLETMAEPVVEKFVQQNSQGK